MDKITRIPLAPGMRLTCITTQKFKTAVFSASLILPLGGKDASALAALPYVLRRGTAGYPDLHAVNLALDRLYGMRIEAAVRARGEALAIGLIADVTDEAYSAAGSTARAAKLLLSFLTEPRIDGGAFCEAFVRGEAENLADRIAARKNDLRSWALRRLWELMCAEEPYGCDELGDAESARALTPERLWQVYQDVLSAAPVELFYCGSQPPATVEAAFRAAAPQRGDRGFSMPGTIVLAAPPHGEQRFEETLPVKQGKLSLGFRTGVTSSDPRYPALLLANAVFGGTTSSRLFRHVREKLSLCYYASSNCYRSKGLLSVASGIDNANAEVARAEILRQLADLQEHGATPEELTTARRSLLASLRAMADSPLSLEAFWLDQSIAGLSWPVETLAEQVSAVTPDELREAARSIVLDTTFFLRGTAK